MAQLFQDSQTPDLIEKYSTLLYILLFTTSPEWKKTQLSEILKFVLLNDFNAKLSNIGISIF